MCAAGCTAIIESPGEVGTSSGPSLRFFDPELGGSDWEVRTGGFCFGRWRGEFSHLRARRSYPVLTHRGRDRAEYYAAACAA